MQIGTTVSVRWKLPDEKTPEDQGAQRLGWILFQPSFRTKNNSYQTGIEGGGKGALKKSKGGCGSILIDLWVTMNSRKKDLPGREKETIAAVKKLGWVLKTKGEGRNH